MEDAPETSQIDPNATADDRQWALFAHLGGLIATAISATAFGFAAPLIIWLLKKEQSRFVEDQAKEALNFQLTVLLSNLVVASVGSVIIFMTCGIGWLIVLPALGLIWVFGIVMPVIAAGKVSDGIVYRYPLTMRLVK